MNAFFSAAEDFFGKAGGFVVGALALTLLATCLLLAHQIEPSHWQAVTLGVWGAVVGGGAVSAFRK